MKKFVNSENAINKPWKSVNIKSTIWIYKILNAWTRENQKQKE